MQQQTGRISARKQESAASTLPEIGKIKIGEKVKKSDGTEYPTSLDYFRVTGTFAGEFQKIYGDKPDKILVTFISNTISEVCNERYESWVGGKRWGWGDGSTFTVFDKSVGKSGTYVENITTEDPRVKALKWDAMLTLRFILPQMRGVLGCWTFQTKGKLTTIPSIVKSFDFAMERAGSIIGFPFNLIVEKKKGYNPGELRNYPMVSLVPNFSEESMDAVREFIAGGGNANMLTTKMVQTLEASTQKQIGGAK